MQTPVNLIPSALGELFAEVNHRGYITVADRYGLLAAIFDETLTEDDKRSIDRLLRSVCRALNNTHQSSVFEAREAPTAQGS
ncbi:MAG: hypothetical protein EAZ25_17860 [Oscillatoriales cyanobacterium]|nr:MAG: hypothetical protein EAZ25_17860 [Oscillatoriales cyanobacterium]